MNPATDEKVNGGTDNVDDKLAEMVERYNFTIPERGIDAYPEGVAWREGKPDYRRADIAFFEGKTKNHLKGSLELIVENLVKKWEMEMTHLTMKDWGTTDTGNYRVQVNGGEERNGVESAQVGTYNWLLEHTSKELYDSEKQTFESSHRIFRGAFKEGFPWEVLEVFSGPPRVAFTWRHWGKFSGVYGERIGQNETIELYGITIATVNEELKIQKLEIFHKPEGFLEALQGKVDPSELTRGQAIIGSGCPIHQAPE